MVLGIMYGVLRMVLGMLGSFRADGRHMDAPGEWPTAKWPASQSNQDDRFLSMARIGLDDWFLVQAIY